jgi:hypothetical protein
MTLLHPIALLWALPAALVVWGYLRARRVPARETGTMFLWQPALAPERPRAAWRRWRRGASAALQLGLLLGLALAMAEPYFGRPRLWVLVIDASGSMAIEDGAPNRFATAVVRARRWIETMAYRDRAAVIVASEPVRVVCGPSSSRADLLRKLEGLELDGGRTTAGRAATIARALAAEHPAGHVVVFTDGCFPGAEQLAAQRDVELSVVGRPQNNVALTQLAARRSLGRPGAIQTLVEVTNFSQTPTDVELSLEAASAAPQTLSLGLAPGQRQQQAFEFVSDEAAHIEASLSTSQENNAIETDDRAELDVTGFEPIRVLLVAEGARRFGLQQALEINPRLAVQAVAALPDGSTRGADARGNPDHVGPNAPGRKAPCDVLVLHRRVPERLPERPVLVIDPADPCELWSIGESAEEAVVAHQEEDTAVLDDVELRGLGLGRAVRIEWGDAAANGPALATTRDGRGVLFAIDRPEGRVVVLLGNLADSDLPQTAAWPVLLDNCVAWLAEKPPQKRCQAPFLGNEGDLRRPVEMRSSPMAVAGPSPWLAIPPWTIWALLCGIGLAVEAWLYHRGWTC